MNPGRILSRVTIFALTLLAAPLAAEAQPAGKVPRLGVLVARSLSSPYVEAFRQGLRELGYVDGQNLIIEYRSGEGKEERLAKLAAELVQLKVAVIAALDPLAAEAAKNSTRTIPIVMRATSDPMEAGLVASLARPGGNITGLYSMAEELIGKRLELLKEVHPEITRVAVLWNPDWPGATRWFKETENAARALGLQLQSLEVRSAKDFETAFQAASRGRAGGLITLRNLLIVFHTKRLVDLAAKGRLPAIYDERAFTQTGGLMSYGANLADLYRRAATFVDKILRGAKPADLPIEQPTKFELVINLKAAKAIGLTIPPAVLARADEVIQ